MTPSVAGLPRRSNGRSTARFSIPAAGFALAGLFDRLPEVRVGLEPAVANPADHALLVVRTAEDRDAVATALEIDPTVTGVEPFGAHGDGWRYRATWADPTRRLVRRFVSEEITLLAADGAHGAWNLHVLTPDRDGIGRANDVLSRFDAGTECLAVSNTGDEPIGEIGLTDDQREALRTAFAAGYYEVPREITANELADRLGISHQALSERFRRAHGHLVKSELAVDA